MQFEFINERYFTEELEPFWEKLVDQSQADPIFCSFQWGKLWWDIFQREQDELRLGFLKNESEILGLVPLYKTIERWGPFKVKALAILGRTTAQYFDFLILDSVPNGIETFIHALIYEKDWDVLSLDRLQNNSPTVQEIEKHAADEGLMVVIEPGLLCPFLLLEGCFEDYFRQRIASKHRNEIKRKWQKLESLGDLRSEVVTDPDDLRNVMKSIIDLDSRAWKAKLGVGIFGNEANRLYYTSVAEALAAKGNLVVHLMYLDDRLVNYQLGFVAGDRYYSYATAYDPQLYRYSPGFLGRIEQIRYCFERGFKIFDFGRFGYHHKKRWTDTASQQVSLHIFAPNQRGRFLGLFLKSRLRLRKAKRRFRPLPEAVFEVATPFTH